MVDTDTANNMFSAYGSIFDAATADNVGVRDRALSVAQLQPGRATVYGAHQAGGMLMQNLAGMAGMKTAEQQKAETITSIMKESQGLDPSDPQSAKLLAQKFIQAGLPGIGQKFLERARTIDMKNQELLLTERGVVVQEERLKMEEKKSESDIKTQESYLKLDWGKFGHTKYKDEEYINLAKGSQELDTAEFEYKQKQDEILNGLREGELELSKARSLLEANDFEFRKARALIEDAQWDKDYDLNKLLADANVKHTEAQTEAVKLSNEYYPKARELEEALTQSQIAANTTKVVDDKLWIKDANANSWHEATTADGKLLSDYETAKGFGITADTKRIIDAVWNEYKQKYYTGGSMYEDAKWGVPEHLAYDEDTNPNGLKTVPTFQDFAKMSVENGGHGGQVKVVAALQAAYGGEGTYVQHLRDTAVIDRKPNQIIRTDDSGEPFLTEFSVDDLSQTYNISTDILGQTAVFPNGENLDKDSNAQIIAELESVRGAYPPDSAEYIAWTTKINDFISSFTTPKDETEAAINNEQVETDQSEVGGEQKVKEQVVEHGTISSTKTEAAIAQTGISLSEGSWKPVNKFLNSAVMSPNMKKEAKYKEVGGVWYVWSGPDAFEGGIFQTRK
jgi:hypothetical protein